MRDALVISALSVIPRNRFAWLMGWFARTRLSKAITRWFVRSYGLNMDEAQGTIDDYPTLESLFIRRLKPGMRPIDPTPNILVSPVDGTVAWVGVTENGEFDIAPGRPLNVSALIGEKHEGEADVAVIYLSPKDYHRIHSPCEGEVSRWSYVPGTLWPVFPGAVERITGLFARNERVVAHLETDNGPLDVVLVGAFGVGRMSLEWTDLLTNTGGKACTRHPEPAPKLERGGDLGAFHLGSTVVLVAPKGTWDWQREVGASVRLGEPFATRQGN